MKLKEVDWKKELLKKLAEADKMKYDWKKMPERSKEEEMEFFIREIKKILEVQND